jgi:hypothetical protein
MSVRYYKIGEPKGISIWQREGGLERCIYSDKKVVFDSCWKEWCDPESEGCDTLLELVARGDAVRITKAEAVLEMI